MSTQLQTCEYKFVGCSAYKKALIAKKYPQLGGHYIESYGDININKCVAELLDDEQRALFFERYDTADIKVKVCSFPKYCQICGFHFEQNIITNVITVTQIN